MLKFKKMLKNNSGVAAAEYALLLAIVGSGIALAAYGLGGKISAAMTSAGTCISSKGTTC